MLLLVCLDRHTAAIQLCKLLLVAVAAVVLVVPVLALMQLQKHPSCKEPRCCCL
jgi:hypothetical protein